MEKTTLIFPSSVPGAMEFYRREKALGKKLLAASSLDYDETASQYEEWVRLPMVYDNTFEKAFAALIKKHNIGAIFCRHPVAHVALRKLIEHKKMPLELIGKSAAEEAQDDLRARLQEAESLQPFLQAIAPKKAPSSLFTTALLERTHQLFGALSTSKIAATAAIFAHAPKGDIVEIGSFWGKSAVMLKMLAQHYQTGALLCVDPWSAKEVVQPSSPSYQRGVNPAWEWDTIFKGFCTNLLPHKDGKINYLRLPSEKAAKHYAKHKKITSPEFGSATYKQKIAVLHIDGNHEYASVKKDYRLWRPYLAKKGWVIFDDYVWPQGDGPRRVADEVLEKEAKNIAWSFVAGKALFIQMK